MTEGNVIIIMSSPINRNARHLPKRTDLSGDVQNSIHVKNTCSPKKEKGTIDKHIKTTHKPLVYFYEAGQNKSLSDNVEKSYIQTPSSIISKEASQGKEFHSAVSSHGYVESSQSNTSGISYTKESTRQKNQYSPESLKENIDKNTPQRKEKNVEQLNSPMPLENKNVEKSNCEVQTIAEMYETSESLPLNTSIDSSSDSAVDKKKERRKMAKKLAKDEKRKQRELEYKKNLQYPKGQRIQVIDHNTFHKILNNAQPLQYETNKSGLSSEEFPSLKVLKPNRFSVMPWQNSSVHSDTEKSNVQDKITNNMGQCMKISETPPVVNGKTINKTGKKVSGPSKLGTNAKDSLKKIGKLPKKRDPIEIDILQCIKMVKSKDAVVEPRKKTSTLERRNESSLLSGNELDSSNPQRSRGKKREKPKKKRPTRLKLIILHERELAKQLKQLQESGLSQVEKAHFGTEKSMNLLTTQSIKVDQAEKVHCGTEIPMTLLTAGSIKTEQDEPFTNVSDSKVVETVLGSTNLLAARDIKLEQMEPVTNVSHNEVVVQKIEDISNNDECKYEVPSSESKNPGAVTDQVLKAEDDSQACMLSSLHITNEEPRTNERIPHIMSSLVCSASEILKKEKQEITSSVKESCCIVNLEQGQHSVATVGDDLNSVHISSNVLKHEPLHRSQIEQCINSLETVSFTDSDMCNKVHQKYCRKFPVDEICDNSADQNETMQKTKIHSRKFRPYCDHFITPEINSSVTTLLQDIVKFHDRQFERDPVKANARRRHIVGLREVLKFLNLKRLKLIIIAPDMELIQGKGGICDIVEQLKEGARNQEVPYVFALQRRILGKITFKKVPVSCIGIINYDGTEKNFHSLVSALQIARAQYQEALTNMCLEETHSEEVDINKQVIEAALSKLTENSSTPCPEQSKLCSEITQKWEE